MSSPPTSGSRAPYIIICNGRIEAAVAQNGFQAIRAASNCAAALVTYYGDRLTYEDTRPISKLQHEMMDLVTGRARAQTLDAGNAMVNQMFTLLDALEDKMKS